MSVTNSGSGAQSAGATSAEVRPKGLKLPPPEPPRFSLTLKIFLAMALLILIAVGGAVAVAAYRARQVADAKIDEDLKKAGPGLGVLPAEPLRRAAPRARRRREQRRHDLDDVDARSGDGRARPGDGLRHAQARAGLERPRRLHDRDEPARHGPRAHGPSAPLLGGSVGGADDRGRAPGRADRGDLALRRQALPRRRDAGPRGRLAADGRDRRGLPDQRRGRVQPRAAPEHAGRVPRGRGQALGAGEGLARGLDAGRRDGPGHGGDRGPAGSRAGGPPPGKDDRAARSRPLRRHLPRLLPADPLLDRPARRRGGGAAEPRPRARRLPPDPDDPDRRGARGAGRSRSSCPSFSRGGSRAAWGGSCARPSRCASETSTPRICRSSRRTRSGSSPAPSARCSTSSARRRRSSSTWRP